LKHENHFQTIEISEKNIINMYNYIEIYETDIYKFGFLYHFKNLAFQLISGKDHQTNKKKTLHFITKRIYKFNKISKYR
jgi:hypothetical protein